MTKREKLHKKNEKKDTNINECISRLPFWFGFSRNQCTCIFEFENFPLPTSASYIIRREIVVCCILFYSFSAHFEYIWRTIDTHALVCANTKLNFPFEKLDQNHLNLRCVTIIRMYACIHIQSTCTVRCFTDFLFKPYCLWFFSMLFHCYYNYYYDCVQIVCNPLNSPLSCCCCHSRFCFCWFSFILLLLLSLTFFCLFL